jgi:hypothetical protein
MTTTIFEDFTGFISSLILLTDVGSGIALVDELVYTLLSKMCLVRKV